MSLTRKEKLIICVGCKDFLLNSHKCNVCGCYIPLKTLIPLSKCPLGKWEVKNESKSNP